MSEERIQPLPKIIKTLSEYTFRQMAAKPRWDTEMKMNPKFYEEILKGE